MFFLNVHAQKTSHKQQLASHIKQIYVNTANCFEVEVRTHENDYVKVVASIEGEYVEDVNLFLNEEENNLLIAAGFLPNFKNPNDKLSAHKVLSISLQISVPAQKKVHVQGTTSRVLASGEYKELSITLSDGDVDILNVRGRTLVKTQSGTIRVTSKKASIIATSKFGVVSKNPIGKGETLFKLETVTGNIELSKTE